MQVLRPPSTTGTVHVQRGALGSCAKPHANGTPVLIGFATELASFLSMPQTSRPERSQNDEI